MKEGTAPKGPQRSPCSRTTPNPIGVQKTVREDPQRVLSRDLTPHRRAHQAVQCRVNGAGVVGVTDDSWSRPVRACRRIGRNTGIRWGYWVDQEHAVANAIRKVGEEGAKPATGGWINGTRHRSRPAGSIGVRCGDSGQPAGRCVVPFRGRPTGVASCQLPGETRWTGPPHTRCSSSV